MLLEVLRSDNERGNILIKLGTNGDAKCIDPQRVDLDDTNGFVAQMTDGFRS